MKTDWPTFGAEYRHPDGSTYSFHFPARDEDDARQRLRAIRGNAELIGELKGSIPASVPGAGIWVRLRCWWGNLFS
jgi:hypothetical protein